MLRAFFARRASRAVAMWLVVGAAAAIHSLAVAQNAGSAPPPAPAPAPVPLGATTPTPAPSTPPTAIALRNSPLRPSRYVSDEDRPAYVKALTESFSITQRATDPFGQAQDPNAKPVVKPTPTTTRRTVVIQPTSFNEIIRRIKVNTIMPTEKKFLIGTRTIRQGDEIPLNFRGRAIMVRVTKVTSRTIDFLNLETNETASLSLGLLPEGMKAGGGETRPPGMVPQTPNAAIEIDSGDPLKPQP